MILEEHRCRRITSERGRLIPQQFNSKDVSIYHMEGSLPQSSPGGKSTNEEFSCMLSSLPSPFFFILILLEYSCLPGGASGKETACQCRRRKRLGFHPWVGKIP